MLGRNGGGGPAAYHRLDRSDAANKYLRGEAARGWVSRTLSKHQVGGPLPGAEAANVDRRRWETKREPKLVVH